MSELVFFLLIPGVGLAAVGAILLWVGLFKTDFYGPRVPLHRLGKLGGVISVLGLATAFTGIALGTWEQHVG